MKRDIKKVTIIANILILSLGFMLTWYEVFKPLDRSMFSYLMTKNLSHQPHEDIIVVGIDERSLQEIGRFPWDRSIYAPLIENMNQPGHEARVIAFDIMFSSESNRDSDEIMADTLARYDNIILPAIANLENDLTRTSKIKKDELIMATSLEKPYAAFAGAAELAHINAALDSDGVIRRTWLKLNTPEGEISSLAFKTAEMAGADVAHFAEKHPQAELLIEYQATSYDFMTVSFISVLNGEFPLENFKDRIVLIGFTAVGFENDNGITPVEKEMKLVYAHANIINQLLADRFITQVDKNIVLVISFILMAFTMWFAWRWRTIISVIILFIVAGIGLVGQNLLYSSYTTYIDTVHPLSAMILTYIVNVSIKSYFETKQKNFITRQFGRYISPDLVKEIAASNQEIQLGGMNKELTILFLDIRGFTTLSEKMHPEQVVGFLNQIFNIITEKTLKNHGTVDKFIGDAAMLIFNAPLDVENHEYYAVKTACDIQEGIAQIRGEIEQQYGVKIHAGIGINTGEVVVGNIGSYLRVDYTAIGDAVNVAARIESETGANQILVSETTYRRTKDDFTYEYVGKHLMKGKTEPVKLYEVKGLNTGPWGEVEEGKDDD